MIPPPSQTACQAHQDAPGDAGAPPGTQGTRETPGPVWVHYSAPERPSPGDLVVVLSLQPRGGQLWWAGVYHVHVVQAGYQHPFINRPNRALYVRSGDPGHTWAAYWRRPTQAELAAYQLGGLREPMEHTGPAPSARPADRARP